MSPKATHRLQRSRLSLLLPVGVTVAAVAAGLVVWNALDADPRSAVKATCQVETVDVTVAPRVRELVEQGLDALRTACLDFLVDERTAGDVALGVAYGGGSLPSLWIGDARWTIDDLGEGGVSADVVSDALVSTPVLVAGAPGAPRAKSWGDVLSTRQVAMPDPLSDSVGALALAGTHVEADGLGRTDQEATSMMVPTAQRYGELAATGGQPNLSVTGFRPGGPRVLVTTEQELVGAPPGSWSDVTPATGGLTLDFPLVVPGDASDQVRRIADGLTRWFDSGPGVSAADEAGWRAGDHSPLSGDRGVGRLKTLPEPGRAVVNADLALWKTLSVPSSILAVFDVSGSMDFDAPGGGTRIDLAVGVARTALGILPDHARVGLWAFSIAQDGDKDYRVMERLRRLDAPVAGTTQRDRLLDQAGVLPTLTRGGTGLNDTTLAAYRSAVQDYNPHYGNAVILLTDGTNDDPFSISEDEMLARLKEARDPERPVRIVAIGLTRDADMGALRAIARATGGTAYQANTPEDVLQVFAREIANR